MDKTIHFLVSGRVQGVFFRACTRDKARECGVTGWVRNRPDGRVEGHATGDSTALERFTAWLREGPDMARVDNLEVETTEPEQFDGFRIR